MALTHRARGADACPDCGTPLANVQGADVCADCGFSPR